MINSRKAASSLFLFLTLLISCQKAADVQIQTFDDVFDISGIEALNAKLESAQTLDDLVSEFKGISISVPDGLAEISLDEMIDQYTKDLKLSSQETDMLLKNESETYLDVVNRFGSLPSNIIDTNEETLKSGSLNGSNGLKSSALAKYLLCQKSDTHNFYANDYYSAIKAYQKYLNYAVLKPLKNLKRLKSNHKDKNGNHEPSPDAGLLYLKLIVSNNKWDMWWAYWNDGTRTKHKGSSGSFPG